MGHFRLLFVYFRSFQTIDIIKTVDFSGIRTQILGVEGDHADRLVTTTTTAHTVSLALYLPFILSFVSLSFILISLFFFDFDGFFFFSLYLIISALPLSYLSLGLNEFVKNEFQSMAIKMDLNGF